MKTKKVRAPRQYHFHFDFFVSGREIAQLDIDGKKREPKKNKKTGKVRRQRGYVCHVEVKAATKKGAAQKIRNRIANMADVANVPEFHYSQVTKGKPVLASDGHNRVRPCKFKRPGVEAVEPAAPLTKHETSNIIDLHAAAMRRRSGGCMSF